MQVTYQATIVRQSFCNRSLDLVGSMTDQNQRQLVDLFHRFWRLRHRRGLRLVCEGDGIRILEPSQQKKIAETSTGPTSDEISPSYIFSSLRSSPPLERGNSLTIEEMEEETV